ncbi:MAG TPA: ergothioneine biosynthesis glutamate--cysteine ligase EgtA [Actinospica sp.]|jgi:glutamate--cysteine ligase|nr:ergothioneine biosynthesis glutamate--cysteine ligase EgtA [Actinospica sp.]
MAERLTAQDAGAHARGVCFKTGPPAQVGLELEWLVHDLVDPLRAVPPARLERAFDGLTGPGAFPGGSRFSLEPGGQVELSSRPGSLSSCTADIAADTEVLRAALAAHGLALAGWGLEPFSPRERILHLPRYEAMEAHFDRGGPWGRRMMRCTAGLQINLDAGEDRAGAVTDWRRRWELAHRLGPVLVAAFANSPIWRGRPTGWRSGRQAVWWRMDATRTRPPSYDPDPRTAWADYALDATVLCIRCEEPGSWDAPAGLTFRGWLDGAAPRLRPPTIEDLDYHLTTLFPPVRPRGWLELRMIDAQHGDEWVVPSAVSTVLFDDPVAAEAAWAATEPLCGDGVVPSEHTWMRAARFGMSAPEFAKPALECFAAAEKALADSPETHAAVSAFIERYVARGRCPADDRLDALPGGASPAPREELQEAWR